jgi:hypothetical protein
MTSSRSHCIVLVPGLKKGGFVVAAKYGRGFVVCRHDSGQGWGPPGAVRIEGGSVGLQIGVSSTDLVLLVMNQRGMKKLLTSKFTLGGDAARSKPTVLAPAAVVHRYRRPGWPTCTLSFRFSWIATPKSRPKPSTLSRGQAARTVSINGT